jgi:hypothetical protein
LKKEILNLLITNLLCHLMTTLLLENTFSINLAGNYFSKNPVMSNDWLCIVLYYDNIIAGLRPSENFNKELINFLEHPFQELIKVNYTGEPPYDTDEINLNAIRICQEKGYDFLLNLNETNRDEFIKFVNEYLPETIPKLKNSFLKFDILNQIIVKNIPTIGGQLTKETEEKLIEFKNGDFGKALVDGINETTEKYKGHYYITKELELQLKNEFIEVQQEFLNYIDFDKIKSFKLDVFLDDGIGIVTGLIIPFLPLGTLKEIFNYLKTQHDFKKNKRLQFMLSIFSLQKILMQEFYVQPVTKHCVICQTTEAEIQNLTTEEVHNFIFQSINSICPKHLVAYLSIRKFAKLTGHQLLIALKGED